MKDMIQFKVFCLEAYKITHKINGEEAYRVFSQYGVFQYLSEFYDVLHSTGEGYLVQDIDLFIKSRKSA